MMTPEQIAVCRASFRSRLQEQYRVHEKRRTEVAEAILQHGHDIIARFPSIQRAYLFGSTIRPGTFHAESDADIGVQGATAEDYFGLWAAFEELLPTVTIDIRDVDPQTHFGRAVVSTGILLYERKDSSSASGDSRRDQEHR